MKISKLLPAAGILAVCVSFASVRAQDNPAQAAAREALMKHMNEVQAPEPQTPPAAPTAPAATVEPAPAIPAEPAAAPAVEAVAPVAPAAIAEPVMAMPETNAVVEPVMAMPETNVVVAPVVMMPETNAVAAPPAAIVNSPGPIPIIAPPLPISMTKEQRLQTLLMLYKADQVTPEQYHTQRAAILAEP